MNIHKNARLTLVRRLEMVTDVTERKLTIASVALAHDVSLPTVRKWVGRYLAHGAAGLADASSRPRVSPRAISPRSALAIVELRRRWLPGLHRPKPWFVGKHGESGTATRRAVALGRFGADGGSRSL